MDEINGITHESNGKIYVSVGSKGEVQLPLEWVSHMLTELADSKRKQFGDLLQSAVFAHLPEQDRAPARK